ncbi:MAG: PAS domain-containing protein [Gemmataceae bacterium]
MNYDGCSGLAQALFEESGDAQFLIDADAKRILDANAAAQRLSGFSLRDLLATSVAGLFQSKSGPGLTPLPPGARRLYLTFELQHVQLRSFQESLWLPVDVIVTRLVVRPQPVAMLTVRDARQQDTPPLPSRRLRHLVTAVSDCLWSAEIANTGSALFQYLSPVVELIAGRPASYFGKDLARWRNIVHPEDRVRWDRAWERRRCGASTEEEYRIIRPDESIRWVRDSVRAGRPEGDKSVWLYGVFADVTRSKDEGEFGRLDSLLRSAEKGSPNRQFDGLIVDWQDGPERLFGYVAEEGIDRPRLRLFNLDEDAEIAESVRQLARQPATAGRRTSQEGDAG